MFWNDPAMQAFHDHIVNKFDDTFITPLEKDLGMKVSDFANLPHGQLTFAVTVNGSNGHDDVPPGLLLLLDAKDQSDSLKTNLATLTKKWTDAGRTLRTESIHGLNFTVVTLSSNDLSFLPQRPPVSEIGKTPKPVQPVDIYFAQSGSLLIVGNSPKTVEPVVDHLTGGNMPSLADNATLAADKPAQFRDAPTYYGWFDAKTFFTLLSQASDDSANPNASPFASQFTPAKIIDALGLDGLQSAGIALREAHDGSALTIHLDAPESTRASLLKILALPAKNAGIPAFVPASAIKFSRVRLDGKQVWAEIQKAVAAMSPNGLASLNSGIDMVNTLAQQKTPGFDLRNNLFGNLGDDIVSYEKAPLDSSLQALASPPAITLVKVDDADKMIQAIRAIASMMATQPDPASATRDYQGHKIYSIALRGGTAPDGSAIPTKPLLVSNSGGYMAFSMNPGILEEYLRSADSTATALRDTPGLDDAAQHVGGMGGGLFGYQNQDAVMRTAFKLWKSSTTSDPTMKLFPPAVRDWADFSLLPDYAAVAKYFYFSVYAASSDDSGLTLKAFSPRPPQLN